MRHRALSWGAARPHGKFCCPTSSRCDTSAAEQKGNKQGVIRVGINANEVQAAPGCDIGCTDCGVRCAVTAGTVNYLARELTRLLGLFPASLEGRDIMAAEIRSVKAHLAAAEQAFARLRPRSEETTSELQSLMR